MSLEVKLFLNDFLVRNVIFVFVKQVGSYFRKEASGKRKMTFFPVHFSEGTT